jgi:ribosomal-protein-serine acetyltransferase
MDCPTLDVNATTRMVPIRARDAARLFVVVDANRAHLRTWLPWLDHNRAATDTAAYIAAAVREAGDGRGAVWLIEHHDILCGVCGFNWIERTNRIAAIGYWLAASHQGRGVMTACVARLMRHGFENCAINRITITVATENVRSQAIPERLGFRKEGIFRQAEWLYDHYVDHILYAQLHSEWQTLQVR